MADIELKGIEKYFGHNHVIRGLDLGIRHGEFVVLLGPSGCGKTTTLRAIAGLETVDSGEILIDGRQVQHLQAAERDIAFVFQLFALYPHLSAFENIAFPLRAMGQGSGAIEQRVLEVARVLRIEPLLHKRPSALSGGDMQRVAIGRAMVRRPKAMLMDEPIGALDAKLREEMRTELKRLHLENEATTVYVTHDQIEAMSMGDRIAIMNDGVLQQVGTPAEVYDHPENLFVAQFIGSPIMNVADCEVRVSGEHTDVALAGDGLAFPFPATLARKVADAGVLEGHLALGVRPEAVLVERAPGRTLVPADVAIVEPLGPFDILDLRVGENSLRARTPAQFVRRSGERVYIRLDEKRTHFFDRTTGRSLHVQRGD
jgi:multiple sugar transport system ATP-binding protein